MPTMAATATSLPSFPNLSPKLSILAVKPQISLIPIFSFTPSPSRLQTRHFFPVLSCSAVHDVPVEEEESKEEALGEESKEEEKRRKLYVVNIPWNFPAPDIAKLFGECGAVKDVEIIKHKNGQSRGFAFVTMASGDEARAAVEKFDSYDLMGRVIRVEFSKSFRKPAPPPPPGTPKREPRNKVYVGNLAWKVRAVNLKRFFSERFNPLSARVVFQSPTGRSAGYGFVAFATMEEADAAVKELDGKELMGRPLRLRISQKMDDESGSEPDETDDKERQPEES